MPSGELTCVTRRLLPTVLIALALAGLTPLVSAQANTSPAERLLFQLTNQVRAQYHLPLLTWDPALARAARLHAQRIASEPGTLEHQYPGEPDLITRTSAAGAHFEAVSENIGRRALNPADFIDAWMQTAPHRATLLNPRLTAIGIGVAQQAGLLAAVQDLSRPVPVLSRGAIEDHTVRLLRAQGLRPVLITATARDICERNAQISSDARLILHWQGSDLTSLPSAILTQLARTAYTSAEIGACGIASTAEGFTTYHVALLLR